jgi:hypothetical protein
MSIEAENGARKKGQRDYNLRKEITPLVWFRFHVRRSGALTQLPDSSRGLDVECHSSALAVHRHPNYWACV